MISLSSSRRQANAREIELKHCFLLIRYLNFPNPRYENEKEGIINGDVLEVNIPEAGWLVEMHDGSHIAIWVHADGSKELAYNENGYTK